MFPATRQPFSDLPSGQKGSNARTLFISSERSGLWPQGNIILWVKEWNWEWEDHAAGALRLWARNSRPLLETKRRLASSFPLREKLPRKVHLGRDVLAEGSNRKVTSLGRRRGFWDGFRVPGWSKRAARAVGTLRSKCGKGAKCSHSWEWVRWAGDRQACV